MPMDPLKAIWASSKKKRAEAMKAVDDTPEIFSHWEWHELIRSPHTDVRSWVFESLQALEMVKEDYMVFWASNEGYDGDALAEMVKPRLKTMDFMAVRKLSESVYEPVAALAQKERTKRGKGAMKSMGVGAIEDPPHLARLDHF